MSIVRNDRPLRQREPRVRDKEYLGWVSQMPCVRCLVKYGTARVGVHCAHIKIGYPEAGWRAFGHSEKSHDHRAVGLCPACHRLQHENRGGDERWFWEDIGIYPPDLCAALVKAFAAGKTGEAVIRKFATAVAKPKKG